MTEKKGGKQMQERNKHIINRFAEYYSSANFPVPSIEKREFGIGNIKKIDARHLNFENEAEFRSYLVSNTPLFVSHSVAYYEFPGATPIQRKNRQGADIVFDLDIHADGGKYEVYKHLEEVKQDAIRLMKDFLIQDFGVRKENLTIVFSGNRGYHIHMRDPDYLYIGSEERRELVDYIKGQGLNYQSFFRLREIGRAVKIESGPSPDEGGYRGRFARTVIETLEKKPSKISRTFSKEEARKRFVEGIMQGNWNKQPYNPEELFKRLAPVAEKLSLRSVDTDAAVTHDLSKLIRVENSIHGSTGLIAKMIDDIDSFEPLRDARLSLENNLKIKFTEDVPEIFFGDATYGPFEKNTEKEIKESVALFFVLKESATIS